MSKALYFDAFSGVSGDMTVGALLALGVPFDVLREQLAAVQTDGYRIEQSLRDVNGIRATKFDVLLDGSGDEHHHSDSHGHQHGHRHDENPHSHEDESHPHEHADSHTRFSEIRRRLEESRLDKAVRERAIAIFTKLAIAEGKVHGKSPEDVSFHEVGAIDSIVDIVGTAIGLTHLKVDEVFVSTMPLGSGFVQCQHGSMPVPAPATVELLQGFSVRYDDGEGELVTPTGAAIVAALGQSRLPAGFRIERVGYGAGTRTLHDRPNLLRLVLGETPSAGGQAALMVIEANIDDSNPEIYEHVFDILLTAGAKDVWLQQVLMKKGRPGVVLSILCDEGLRDVLAGLVLRETSSIGVRFHGVDRLEAPRSEHLVDTEFGPIVVKISRAPDGTVNVAPEYEVCRKVALAKNVALKRVYSAAIAAASTIA